MSNEIHEIIEFRGMTAIKLLIGGRPMPSETKRRSKKKIKRRYRPPPVDKPPNYSVEMICPLCGRRACDLSDSLQEPLWVGMKCPHCHKVVHLQVPAKN